MGHSNRAFLAVVAATLLSLSTLPRAAEGAGDAGTPLDRYGALLGKYVTPQGVRYAAWRAVPADVQALTGVVEDLTGTNVQRLTNAERHALLINLYNAKILEIVVTKSPKTSIKEITPGITGYGVFLKSALRFDGKMISLRDLEDRLREDSKDPRIHFAINCASKSCPPIASEPYRATALDEQLDRAAHAFLAAPGSVVVSRGGSADKPQTTIQVSKIFDWYAKDFEASGGAVAFLQKYGPPDVAAAIKGGNGKIKLDYQDYDWSLNKTD